MLIFAVDSSGATGSAAIVRDEILVSERFLNTGLTHSETLLSLCDGVFSDTGYSPSDIDYYAVSSGPGSFTGLRIGISAVKGMAFAEDKPCVGISTLEAYSRSVLFSDAVITPVLDARRDRVYCAAFLKQLDGKLTRILKDSIMTIEDLTETLTSFRLPVLFVGDAGEICQSRCETKIAVIPAPGYLKYLRASSVAAAAYEQILLGNTLSAGKLVPNYIQQSQAEREIGDTRGCKEIIWQINTETSGK